MEDTHQKSFATRAVHAGEGTPAESWTPVVGPIHPSVGFTYESMADLDLAFDRTGEPGGASPVYPRYGSPTVAAFEAAVADLEGGRAAHAFASGMAALHVALLSTGLGRGGTLLAALDLYGATFTLARSLFAGMGVRVEWVDVSDLEQVSTTLDRASKEGDGPLVLLAEVISNPLLKVADVPALAEWTRRWGARFILDNTFASPYLFTPLAYGVETVVHSATKYIAGHGDVMAGVAVTSAEDRARMYELNKLVGSVLGPFEAWLALRGLKTLPLRVARQCDNAMQVAAWLAGRAEVERVIYPGLPDHPQHELAAGLFAGKGFGGVLSFDLAGVDRGKAFRFMESLRLCKPATTLGDIYTLVLHPATSSHRSLSTEERARVGISDGLVRLSTGIEDPADILADLEGALAPLKGR